jgi:chromosome segregation ATPase
MKKTILLVFLIVSILSFASFKDVPVNHWAYDAVNELSKLGIVSGMPDGTFQGNQAMTRYQVAVALYRLMQNIQDRIDKAISGSANVEKIREQVLTLSDLVSTALNKIDSLSSLKDNVQVLSNDVSELKTSLVNLKDDMKNFTFEFAQVKNLANDNLKKITTLEEKLNNLSNNNLIEKINSDISVLKTDLNSKADKTTVEQLFKNISELSTKVDSLSGDISVLRTDLKTVSKKSDEQIAKINDTIASIQQLLNQTETKISSLEEYVANNYKTLDSRIAALSGDFSQLKVDYESYAANTSKKIDSLNSSLNQIDEKLSTFEAKVTDLEGLKNDYNSFKTNTEQNLNELNVKIQNIEEETSKPNALPIVSLILSIIAAGISAFVLFNTLP